MAICSVCSKNLVPYFTEDQPCSKKCLELYYQNLLSERDELRDKFITCEESLAHALNQIKVLREVAARAHGTKICQLCRANYVKGEEHEDDCPIKKLDTL